MKLGCCAKSWGMIGAISAGLAVILGAFAAHGLDGLLVPQYSGMQKTIAGMEVPASWKYLQDFKTAADYQMYHALGLIAVGLMSLNRGRRSLQIAGYSFVIGTVLFSGSLYVLAVTGMRWLGAIAPFGGTAFIVGWFALAAALCPCRAESGDTPAVTELQGSE